MAAWLGFLGGLPGWKSVSGVSRGFKMVSLRQPELESDQCSSQAPLICGCTPSWFPALLNQFESDCCDTLW